MRRATAGVIGIATVGLLSGCTSASRGHADAAGTGGSTGAAGRSGTPIEGGVGGGGFDDAAAGGDATTACRPGTDCPIGACAASGICVCGLPLVCFGTDPTIYARYLAPRDGAPTVGQCPTPDDFNHQCAEGSVCYYACGPLSATEIRDVDDAGIQPTSDAGAPSCCFWVFGIAGL